MLRFVKVNDGIEYVCCDGVGDEDCDVVAAVALVEDNDVWCGQAACHNEKHLANAVGLHEWRKADEWAWTEFHGPVA